MAKGFEGVWIGAEMLRDRRFSKTELLVYSYMCSFRLKFHASDAHMAKTLGTTEQTIRNTVTKLRKKGFICGHNQTRRPRPYDMTT